MDYKKIMQEIEELSVEKMMQVAEQEHNDEYGNTEVYYNHETKEIEAFCVTPNTSITKDNLIFLFEIQQNSYINCGQQEDEFWNDTDGIFDIDFVREELKEYEMLQEQQEQAEKEYEAQRKIHLAEMQDKIKEQG